jgi:hypothetical protein
MSLDRRITKADKLSQPTDAQCPQCGWQSGQTVEYEVITDDREIWEDSGEEATEEFCGYCGRQISYIVTWVDASEETQPHVQAWIQEQREIRRTHLGGVSGK